MSEEFVKQHVVPKGYLRNFGKESRQKKKNGNCKYFIGTRFFKDGRKHPIFIESNTGDVGFEKKLYDTTAQKDPKHWEHFLDKRFDTLCGTPLREIISIIRLSMPNRKVLTPKHKENLSKIILSQYIRTVDALDTNLKHSARLLKDYKKVNVNND